MCSGVLPSIIDRTQVQECNLSRTSAENYCNRVSALGRYGVNLDMNRTAVRDETGMESIIDRDVSNTV